MDGQPPYKSSEKIIEEEIIKRQLEFPTSQIERLLYKIYKKVNEKVNNKFEIREYFTEINLSCKEPDKEPMQCEGYIKTTLYIKDKYTKYKVGNCLLDPQFYKAICTDYSGKSFELFDSPQNISFTDNMIEKILSTLYIAYPEVFEHIDNRAISMIGSFFIYPHEPINENPEMYKGVIIYKEDQETTETSKYIYEIFYNRGRFRMAIAFTLKGPNKL